MSRSTSYQYLLCWAISFISSMCHEIGRERRLNDFPTKIIGAYGSWNECDEKMIHASRQGANVLLWFAINLITNPITGVPDITSGLDFDCVANVTKTLRDMNLPTVHMISVGGWNSPHPSTANSPHAVYQAWKRWNEVTIARPSLGFFGFDGIDWDIEGNDNQSSAYNYMTISCLNLIGQFSQYAKTDGYFVSMAPAESYLDSTSSLFDRYLNHSDPEWDNIVPGFAYHGHNAYAYLLAKFGRYANACSSSSQSCRESENTFDMVSIQLYEGYSHADYNCTQIKQPFSEYLINFVEQTSVKGWTVDFQTDPSTDILNQTLTVFTTQLVIGLANGWAAKSDDKFLYIDTESLKTAYRYLLMRDIAPKGFMYWDVGDDGIEVNGTKIYMSKELNSFMNIR